MNYFHLIQSPLFQEPIDNFRIQFHNLSFKKKTIEKWIIGIIGAMIEEMIKSANENL